MLNTATNDDHLMLISYKNATELCLNSNTFLKRDRLH